MEVNNNFPTNYLKWPQFCCLCNEQLDYKDNLLETNVNLHDFYSLNLWKILSGGLAWSSHTVINPFSPLTHLALFLHLFNWQTITQLRWDQWGGGCPYQSITWRQKISWKTGISVRHRQSITSEISVLFLTLIITALYFSHWTNVPSKYNTKAHKTK